MEYLAGFAIIFAAIQMLVAISNLIFSNKIKVSGNVPDFKVSVLIPARNEEQNIGNLLNDLINQDYKNLEILVFDDQSDDKTAIVVEENIAKDSRIKLLKSNGLAEGWLGKNFACYSLSQQANGKYFLFLDADVRIDKDLIVNTLSFSVNYKSALLSIFPKQIVKNFGEKITVPNMNFILLTLLPLFLVHKSGFSSLAAANGQFMLFDSEAYKQMQPHLHFKNEKVEDIQTARLFKKDGLKVVCLSALESVKCRMYNGFDDAVNGFSKNVFHFFGNSSLLAFLFWGVTTFGFIPVLYEFGFLSLALYLIIILFTRYIVAITGKLLPLGQILLAIPQQVALGCIIFKAFINKFNKRYQWKGRWVS